MRLNHKSTSNMYMLSFFLKFHKTVAAYYRHWKFSVCFVLSCHHDDRTVTTFPSLWNISIDNILNDAFELWMGGSSRNAVWKSTHRGGYGRTMRIYIRLYGSPCRRPRENQTIIHLRLFMFRQFILQSLQNKLLFTKLILFKFKNCSKGKQKRCRTQRGQRW